MQSFHCMLSGHLLAAPEEGKRLLFLCCISVGQVIVRFLKSLTGA